MLLIPCLETRSGGGPFATSRVLVCSVLALVNAMACSGDGKPTGAEPLDAAVDTAISTPVTATTTAAPRDSTGTAAVTPGETIDGSESSGSLTETGGEPSVDSSSSVSSVSASTATSVGPVTDQPSSDMGSDESNTTAHSDTSAPPVPGRAVYFEPSGGTFETVQAVTLTANFPIRYTLDGSLPDATSPLYEGPIVLQETTILRVYVPAADGISAGTYGSQTYVQLRSDALDFTSNLPIVVIDRHQDTPLELESNELRPASVLVFEPGDDERAHLLGQATLSSRAGVRVRGAFSRFFPQVSYAVETREAGSDSDDAVPFLGMPAESDWVLSAPSEMDRALMRNRFAMDLSRKLGHYASQAKFVEVFLVDNEETATLGMSDYRGAYTALEKIKRDNTRVAIAKLGALDVSEPAISGGYIFRIDRDQDFTAGDYDFGWVYPEPEDMLLTEREPQVDYVRGYLSEFFECLTIPDFTHPQTSKHYSEYIDVPSFIDHNLMTALTKNIDGLRLSAYFYKERNERVVAGPVWDFDRSLGTPHDERAVRPDEWAMSDGTDPLTWGFWYDLFEDPAFANAYWTRWDQLRQGAFSREQLLAMIDGYEAELTEARVRHFERWTELPPLDSPEYEVELIRDWLTERVAWIDEQRP